MSAGNGAPRVRRCLWARERFSTQVCPNLPQRGGGTLASFCGLMEAIADLARGQHSWARCQRFPSVMAPAGNRPQTVVLELPWKPRDDHARVAARSRARSPPAGRRCRTVARGARRRGLARRRHGASALELRAAAALTGSRFWIRVHHVIGTRTVVSSSSGNPRAWRSGWSKPL
jgi:hypothetical protein